MNHPYFGTLDLSDDVIWESELMVDGYDVEAILWAQNPSIVTDDVLDQFAKHCEDIALFHEKALLEITRYLQQDDSFIKHYTDNIEDYTLPDLQILIQRGLNALNFTPLMTLNEVNLWIEGNNTHISLDYMIDPEQSDQILMVKFDLAGNFMHIAWES